MYQEHISISRAQMIERLTRSMFDDIEANLEKIEEILLFGFRGFERYTNMELMQEYAQYVSEDPEVQIVITLID